nr:protein RRP5 homolog [Onthophagus taurus]
MPEIEEANFPRGGSTIKKKRDDERPKQKNLFSVNEHQKKKKIIKSIQSKKDSTDLHLNSVDLLAYNKIQPSMIILGCVKEVLGVTVKVQLPGTLYADVQVNSISDKLTKELIKNEEFYNSFNLKDLFEIGDCIPVQILENKETNQGNKRLIATTNPMNINHQSNCNSFRKGMLVWGAILEKADHVYSIDLGVQNVRCILNIKDCDENDEYIEGQPLWVLIKNIESSNNITTIMVTTSKDVLNDYDSPICNLDILCPGSCVDVKRTKILKNGIEVTFFDGLIGYINKIYLDSTKNDLNFKAYVLYKNPITKFTYFTTTPPHLKLPPPNYPIGTVSKSTIIDDFAKGVLVEFKNGDRGFITFKRLIKSLKVKDNADIQSLITEKYPKGKKVECRIMDYSYIDKMYICTFETDIIKEKYFSKTDFKPGEIVSGKIIYINRSGVVVKVGMVECFVTNEQLTNVLYSENVKLKFKVGKNVKGRVLSVDPTSVKLTLKPALLEEHECLCSYKDAKLNKSYLGVVVFIKQHMVIVKFYNEVKGIVLDKEKKMDFKRFFYQGQVITVSVVHKKNENLLLSIGESDKKENIPLDNVIGKNFDGKITKITNTGVFITTTKNNLQGFIPLNYLNPDLKLSKIIIDNLKLDQKLSGLICLKSSSSTDCLFTLKQNLKIPTKKSLKAGVILHGFVDKFDGNDLIVDIFTKNGVVKVNVAKNSFFDDESLLDQNKFEFGQQLLVKLISKVNKNEFNGTIKFSEVFGGLTSSSIYLQKQLNDMDLINNILKESKAILNYKVGQKVNVRLMNLSNNDCIVETNDGIKGIANKENMLKNMKLGSIYTARILFINIIDNQLEITFKPKVVNQKILEKIDFKNDEEPFATILLIRENLAICSLKLKGKKSFGFIPIKRNENDFKPDLKFLKAIKDKFRFTILSKNELGFIGFPKDLFKKSILKEKKRKLSEVKKDNNKQTKNDKEDDVENKSEDDDANIKQNTSCNDDLNELEKKTKPKKRKLEKEDLKEPIKPIEKPLIPISTDEFKPPSMKSFFEPNLIKESNSESDSDNESDENERPKKKKKLTKKEQIDLLKQEEENLRKIELSYADMTQDSIPQTADQFDRRLLAEPNSSSLWIQYASLHISNTEIDKARTIFRRAVQNINPTLTVDVLNVWTAFINLEHLYGTKETFSQVFNEAVQYNDDLTIYTHAITALSSSHNPHDVDDLILKMLKKFKQEPKMYVDVAKVYYKQKRFAEARKLRSKALGTLIEKKKHIPLIIQFAKLEFDNDEDEYAETLFETILKDAPQRVDVWTVYVDQLVKKNKIDLARRVLQRAVGQKLKIAKMTSLCKKYVAFEREFGTDESRNVAEGILNDVFSSVKRK